MTINFNKIILKIALGASLFATCLQASDYNNILEEPISKKRPAEDEPARVDRGDQVDRVLNARAKRIDRPGKAVAVEQ